PRRELPAPRSPVDAERGEHREQCRHLREAEQQQLRLAEHEQRDRLELPEQEPERERAAADSTRMLLEPSALALDPRGELRDPLLDLRVLRGLRGKQIERAAPARDAFRELAAIDRLLRLARERRELRAGHEAEAARTREQRGCELGAAVLTAGPGR